MNPVTSADKGMAKAVQTTEGRPVKKSAEEQATENVTELLLAQAHGETEFEKARERQHLSRRQANQIIEAFWIGYGKGLKADLKPLPVKYGGEPDARDAGPQTDPA